jgi:hypothetical protein
MLVVNIEPVSSRIHFSSLGEEDIEHGEITMHIEPEGIVLTDDKSTASFEWDRVDQVSAVQASTDKDEMEILILDLTVAAPVEGQVRSDKQSVCSCLCVCCRRRRRRV